MATTVPNSIEGGRQVNEHNASFYVEQAAIVTWTEVRFTDHLGDEFIAREFILEAADANAVDISFDARDIAEGNRVVHGVVQGTSRIELPRKPASSIRVKRNGGTDGVLRIWAWR